MQTQKSILPWHSYHLTSTPPWYNSELRISWTGQPLWGLSCVPVRVNGGSLISARRLRGGRGVQGTELTELAVMQHIVVVC